MKDIKNKLTRYSTAVGALLAVSATANAKIDMGVITPSKDNIIDHDGDIVYIDMNKDGIADFKAQLWSSVWTSSTSSGSTYTTSSRSAWVSALNSAQGFVAVESSGNYPDLTKFDMDDPIGPINYYAHNWGYIFSYSGLGKTAPAGPLTDDFDGGETGFIGVGLDTGHGPHYGWIQIQVGSGGEYVEIMGAAYETSANTPITAGATVPLLPIASAAGLGLVGLMAALKRRKNNKNL
jgi:hypothetical protein